MTINKIPFNIYMTCILISIFLAILYVFYYLKKDKIEKRLIWLSIIMVIPYILIGGIILNYLSSPNKTSLLKGLGLSSYGGAFGLIIAVLIYEAITKEKRITIRYIISIPLIYSISKLGCFFAGCCYGIPYNGPLYVYYPHVLKYKLFPIQLLETIVFLILFTTINKIYNKYKTEYIIEYTILLGALFKFLLDFLRYSHINKIFSLNQYISIITIIITIIILMTKIKINSKRIQN